MILDFICRFCGDIFFAEKDDAIYCQGKVCCADCFEGVKK